MSPNPAQRAFSGALALLLLSLVPAAGAHDGHATKPPILRAGGADPAHEDAEADADVEAHRKEDFGFPGSQRDPKDTGAWSPVFDSPVVAVQTTLLPDGKLLIWDSIGDTPEEQTHPHDFTRAALWDATTNVFTRVDNTSTGYNIFCSGFAHLPDGRIVAAGGNRNAQQDGIDTLHLFDPATSAWSLSPQSLASDRWSSASSLAAAWAHP